MNREISHPNVCEWGVVCEVDGSFALVEFGQQSSCQKCAFAVGCSATPSLRTRKVWAENRVGAKVGEAVKISISSYHYVVSAGVFFVLPLIALILGYIVFYYAGVSQWLSAIVGILLSAIAIIIARVLEKSAFSKRLYSAVEIMDGQKTQSS